MKFYVALAEAVLASALLVCCSPLRSVRNDVPSAPEGEFVYNVPCKVVNIHQEKPGKSIMFLWLHGGVHDTAKHDLFGFNHLDCCAADDSVLCYLQKKGIKAVCLFPVCHRAVLGTPIHWRDCFDDVKAIMDAYIDKGMIDTDRIYLAGSSDGGVGTWDYVEAHSELFAVAMPMSCGHPRKTELPVFFFNTSDEYDCTEEMNALHAEGYGNIVYKFCADQKHGGDAAECTEEFLDKYFSFTR